MVNNGNGGCSVFVVLLLVAVVFGAGYLLAQSEQVAVQNQIGERALEMTGEAIATLVPQATQAAELRVEVERVRADASAAVAAQVKAENERIAAEAARQQAERAMAEAIAARARAEGESAAANAARQQAENNLALANAEREKAESERADALEARGKAEQDLAVAEHNLAVSEHNLAVGYGIYQDQQATIDRLQGQIAASAQLPVTGKPVGNLTGKLVSDDSLLPMLGIALFGLVTGIVVMRIMTPASRAGKTEGMPVLTHDSRYTYVKMTREEARQYARQRGK